jgi:murein tripeptide amidase MpaA
MKTTIVTIIIIAIVAVAAYFMFRGPSNPTPAPTTTTTTTTTTTAQPTTTTPAVTVDKTKTVIGKSVNNADIVAYHYGSGDTDVLFVGGIHGGYEANTVQVAYELMDYLKDNPTAVPANVTVTVIPVLNPDGLVKAVNVNPTTGRFTSVDVSTSQEVLTSGRFNANKVDLNRNFDCDWKSTGVWQSKTVSGGIAAFSEPESQAFKTYIDTLKPAGVVVWYSAAGGVYSSNCHNGVLPITKDLTKAFATASKYPAHEEFSFYEITGDAVNWLAKQNIPAISVLLTDHKNTEWTKNLAGIKAVLGYFAK